MSSFGAKKTPRKNTVVKKVVAEKKTNASRSIRLQEAQRTTVLDEATRMRRIRRFLESLNADNYHEDPHSNLVMSKKLPKFEEPSVQTKSRKKKAKSGDYYNRKYGRPAMQCIEDDLDDPDAQDRPTYQEIEAPDSKFPPTHSCTVCGYNATYNCIVCGVRVCQTSCFRTHFDTRCLKWY